MKRVTGLLALLGAATAVLVVFGGTAAGSASSEKMHFPQSGTSELRDVELGHFITECPQAGRGLDDNPKPLDRRQIDDVEKLGSKGDDRRANQDYSCFPQNETSIDVNPDQNRNIVGGANDYRLGTGSSGFYASTDGGRSWYDGIIPFPSAAASQSRGEGFVPSGGDPIIAFDRAGIVYYGMIGFFRGDDTNGVFVSRSSNGGFTWSRARIGGSNTPTPSPGPNTDPRQPGDGVVNFFPDPDGILNGSVPFEDKPYMTTGPRPNGVAPQCFTPTHTPTACGDPRTIGVDRIHYTWTRFDATGSRIQHSYSDDQARSWSPAKTISGNAVFCVGAVDGSDECSFNQGSTPTVNPSTGYLYVSFLNGNTPDENQYLVVRSKDGGNTFEGPFFASSIFDINYPRANATRPDCINRGAQTRSTLTNSCFRVNPYGGMVVDRRGGDFADDLYLVLSDNRNGNPASSNVDVFLMKSTDGGETWLGPTRVNNDNSVPAPDRDCGRVPGFLPVGNVAAACGGVGNFGNDQWFPWVDVSSKGDLNVVFFDRRNDVSSTAAEWPTTRAAGRAGNYLTWFFGAVCRVNTTAKVHPDDTSIPAKAQDCLARQAEITGQPTEPVDPGPNPVPGQNQTGLPFKNFQVSDTPFNLDYAFRAGIFVGDYNNVAIADKDDTAFGFWTDSRNGRSSGGPAGGVTNPSQVGRNPACEQSDAFVDKWNSRTGNNYSGSPASSDSLFLVTPCPEQVKDKKSSG